MFHSPPSSPSTLFAEAEPSKRGTMGFTVELFRLRDKNVPVDVLDIPVRVFDVR